MEINDQELYTTRNGRLAVMVLNRPRALNALTLEMVRLISACLQEWEEDDSVAAVLIYGAGDRAFCAGGDIKAAYYAGMSYRRGTGSLEAVSLFFGEEYLMNRRLFHYRKPLVAFMDGITMGGGYGVAGPCRYRVATEKTIFAMPEVGIGFFPDVGGTYFLSRAPGQAGTYLALSGRSVGAADMIYAGLASHYTAGVTVAGLAAKLAAALPAGTGGDDAHDAVARVLDGMAATPPGGGVLEPNRRVIDHSFGQPTLEGILQSLVKDGSAWSREAASTIAGRSPISLKVTLHYMRLAARWAFDDVMDMDFLLAQHFIGGHDYYEGVRAAVIDKDRQPQWDPARIEDVSEEMIARYFQKTGRSLSDVAA